MISNGTEFSLTKCNKLFPKIQYISWCCFTGFLFIKHMFHYDVTALFSL